MFTQAENVAEAIAKFINFRAPTIFGKRYGDTAYRVYVEAQKRPLVEITEESVTVTQRNLPEGAHYGDLARTIVARLEKDYGTDFIKYETYGWGSPYSPHGSYSSHEGAPHGYAGGGVTFLDPGMARAEGFLNHKPLFDENWYVPSVSDGGGPDWYGDGIIGSPLDF